MSKLQGFIEVRRYRTRYWNNGDRLSRYTDWCSDVDESYKVYKSLVFDYDNTEWIEEITHSLSGIGVEACNCEPKWSYDPSRDMENKI